MSSIPVKAVLSSRNDEEDDEIVKVPLQLWEQLVGAADAQTNAVAISAVGNHDADRYKIAVVRLDTNSDSSTPIQLPLSLYSPFAFGSTAKAPSISLTLSPTTLLPLSEVILLSLTPTTASANSESVKSALLRPGKVVRQDDLLTLPNDGGKWKVVMTSPVLQGVARFPQKGEEGEGEGTRVVLLPYRQGTVESANGTADGVNGKNKKEDAENHEEEEIDLDIPAHFLARSLLAPLRSSLSNPPSRSLSTSSLSSSILSSSTLTTSNRRNPKQAQPIPVLLRPLLTPLANTEAGVEGFDETHTAMIPPADLGRLGVVSGSWGVVKMVDDEGDAEEEGWIVRILGLPSIVTPTTNTSTTSPTLYLPPSLLASLPSASTSSSYTFTPTPVPPSPPTALSVTLARIATPESVHKKLLPLFLRGLRDHFSSAENEGRRTVREGMVIVVRGELEKVRFVKEGETEEEGEEFSLPASTNSHSAKSSTLAYFLVTSLTLPPTAQSQKYGIVSPSETAMLQSGVVNKVLKGDWAQFYGISPLPTPPPTSSFRRLQEYLSSLLSPGARELELGVTVLLKGARGSGKRTLVQSVARESGWWVFDLDAFDIISDTDLKTEGHLRARVERAISCAPCVVLLRNVEALARKSQVLESGGDPPMTTILREIFESVKQGWKAGGYPTVVIGTTTDVDKIPNTVLGLFKEEIGIEAPSEPERLSIITSLTSTSVLAPDVSLRALAVQTAALVANDLVDLVRRAREGAVGRVLKSLPSSNINDRDLLLSIQHASLPLTSVDFNLALEGSRAAYSESIGAPRIPNVTWDDVGGLASVKGDILDTIQLPLEKPELFADGLKKRSGILLYGPPGTGKTLLAKAVATSCSLNFFSVKGPELLNMYIGESEANVRRVFQRARDAKPCVIFFDELDSVAPKRGNQGDSGGVMDRIVSQLLAELDGMSEGKGGNDVFVIGATNRPDLLDPALLRPGRFDRMLYLGVSTTHDAQLNIMQALTRKFALDPSCDLRKVAEMCPFNYTGADFYALCSDAMLKAMTRKAEEVDKRIADLNSHPPHSLSPLTPQYYLAELATPEEIAVLVAQQDFEAALSELVPSVSQAEMEHYRRVQKEFSGDQGAPVREESKTKTAEVIKEPKKVDSAGKGDANGSVNREGEQQLLEKKKDRKGKGKAKMG
ncbi:AAA-domain-containing protein [Meredithblackwellia eburnea MCA 4105]